MRIGRFEVEGGRAVGASAEAVAALRRRRPTVDLETAEDVPAAAPGVQPVYVKLSDAQLRRLQVDPPSTLTVSELIARGGVLGAGGGLASGMLVGADKVAAMSKTEISTALTHGSSLVALPKDVADNVADVARSVADNALGRFLLIAVAGGTVAVFVVKAVRPDTGWWTAVLIGVVVGAAVLLGLVYADRAGLLVDPPARPAPEETSVDASGS